MEGILSQITAANYGQYLHLKNDEVRMVLNIIAECGGPSLDTLMKMNDRDFHPYLEEFNRQVEDAGKVEYTDVGYTVNLSHPFEGPFGTVETVVMRKPVQGDRVGSFRNEYLKQKAILASVSNLTVSEIDCLPIGDFITMADLVSVQ